MENSNQINSIEDLKKVNAKNSINTLASLIAGTNQTGADKTDNQQIIGAINDIFEPLKKKKELLLEAAEITFDYFNKLNNNIITEYIAFYIIENGRRGNIKFNNSRL
jgi:hypothetical protein